MNSNDPFSSLFVSTDIDLDNLIAVQLVVTLSLSSLFSNGFSAHRSLDWVQTVLLRHCPCPSVIKGL